MNSRTIDKLKLTHTSICVTLWKTKKTICVIYFWQVMGGKKPQNKKTTFLVILDFDWWVKNKQNGIGSYLSRKDTMVSLDIIQMWMAMILWQLPFLKCGYRTHLTNTKEKGTFWCVEESCFDKCQGLGLAGWGPLLTSHNCMRARADATLSGDIGHTQHNFISISLQHYKLPWQQNHILLSQK